MNAAMPVTVLGALPLKAQIEILKLPKAKRRRFLGQLTRKVISNSKQRVKTQRDLDGKPFAARKRKRARKMLSKMARQLKTIRNDGNEAVAGWHDPIVGRIAAKHQHGHVEAINARQLAKTTKGNHSDPATRRQAKALREVGYKIKGANGKRKKTPSLKWITANMNIGQAGAALRYLREQAGETIKTSWIAVLPDRSFLGASGSEIPTHVNSIYKQMTQELSR